MISDSFIAPEKVVGKVDMFANKSDIPRWADVSFELENDLQLSQKLGSFLS